MTYFQINTVRETRVKLILSITLSFIAISAASQDDTLQVHFLYGSKPAKAFKDSERKWFGGKLGGHVGVKANDGQVLSFFRRGKFHWFANKKNKHSRYALHSSERFYSIFGCAGSDVKKAVVYIPINSRQKQRFDSLTASYLAEPPYDYAFIGMRCGAATYEILGQLEILPRYRIGKTARKIFYPKKLRRRLFKKANEQGWTIIRQDGSVRRRWEGD
jgi:hypothetical protein